MTQVGLCFAAATVVAGIQPARLHHGGVQRRPALLLSSEARKCYYDRDNRHQHTPCGIDEVNSYLQAPDPEIGVQDNYRRYEFLAGRSISRPDGLFRFAC
jgi:hypothetical protein